MRFTQLMLKPLPSCFPLPTSFSSCPVRSNAAHALKRLLESPQAREHAISTGIDAQLQDLGSSNTLDASLERDVAVSKRDRGCECSAREGSPIQTPWKEVPGVYVTLTCARRNNLLNVVTFFQRGSKFLIDTGNSSKACRLVLVLGRIEHVGNICNFIFPSVLRRSREVRSRRSSFTLSEGCHVRREAASSVSECALVRRSWSYYD